MLRNKLICITATLSMAICQPLSASTDLTTPTYEPIIHTIPDHTAGTACNRVSLDGKWQARISPKGRWHTVNVPGELAMQGISVKHGETATYRRRFTVPADFAGKRTIIRFNGTYSYATLRINGRLARTHRGGFTRWDTDITPYIKPGRANTIELDLTDPIEEISYASGYAHHPIAGILRNVELFSRPEQFFTDLRIDAELDSLYRDGVVKISLQTDFNPLPTADAVSAEIRYHGQPVATGRFALKKGKNDLTLPVVNPAKWDAEHPNLYDITLRLTHDGKETALVSKQIGFRKIEVDGNRMLVNGQPVKLRGACRHDIHPSLGRSTDRRTDSIDAALFKEANMNFVRTSHYPPSEDFLEFCDRLGIYVESESAVCFVDTHRQKNYAPGASQDDPSHTAQYLSQLAEMAKNFQSHPSILFWSIGNESKYGKNFQKSYDWIKSYDTTRPAIFSYPGSVPSDRDPIYDLASMHYQDVNGNLWQWGVESHGYQVKGYPVIFDEWAHPACYTYQTLQHDPGIREFWGKSLDMMWNGVYNTPGALGGAIWGYIDEVFFLPEPEEGTAYWKEFAHTAKPEGFRGNCVGYGEWGIVDIHRRKKPEFWATKKAYSPVRIKTPRTIDQAPYTDILLDIYNRFDHTDLSETKATARHNGELTRLEMPSAAPHEKTVLRIPGRDWKQGDSIIVEISDRDGQMIDRYVYSIGADPKRRLTALNHGTLQITDSAGLAIVENQRIRIPISRATGLITDATIDGDTVIGCGPFLNTYINYNHLTGAEVRKTADHFIADRQLWRLQSIDTRIMPTGDALAEIKGSYGNITVAYQISVTAEGLITVNYSADGLPEGYLRETGLTFDMPDTFNELEWERKGYWDNYPDDAMSGNRGRAQLYNTNCHEYGSQPSHDWASDTRDYYYWADNGTNADRPLTMRAKAMKENISSYTLTRHDGASITIVSPEASHACRLDKPDGRNLRLCINSEWDYPEIAWGNYCKAASPLPCHGQIKMQLHRSADSMGK